MENKELSQQKRVNKVILYGLLASITLNLLMFLNCTARPIGTLQAVICMKLPCYLAIPALGFGILIKGVLRGKIPNQEWDIEHAKAILIQNNSLLRKVLARLYVLIYYPLYFIGGWVVGSLAFYYLALIITKK